MFVSLLSIKYFADCTGDATIGFLAGADFRMGREGKDETGESLAPSSADEFTLGSSNLWYASEKKDESEFPECPWALQFSSEYHLNQTKADWRWETGFGHFNTIKDAEKIEEHTGIVTIRLFNVVAKELGPVFMKKGVMVDGGAMQSFLKTAAPVLTSSVYTLIVDGEETAMPVLLEKDWHMQMIRLTIQTVGDNKG